jgi:peptidoglycan/LPS O-acetylase OafA/YrhL
VLINEIVDHGPRSVPARASSQERLQIVLPARIRFRLFLRVLLVPNEHARKFLAIDGLLVWIAWAVVFSHLTYLSAFNARGLSSFFRLIGLPSVIVFIIVSGFVVTHVILEKRDAYGPYLIKRFARIFPLLAVTCFIGFFSNDLLSLALGDPRFGDPQFAKVAADIAASDHSHLSLHLLAHILMLHGAVPNAVLMDSEYAFNMPAWSISLEWQFYVLAPLIIFVLLDKRQFLIPLALGVAASEIALRTLGSGTVQPGALPLAAVYFATGILSRLAYSEKFETYRGLSFTVALAIVFFPFSQFWPFMIWLIVFFGLPIDRLSNPNHVERFYKLVLQNRLALYFGSRSYSIYLCHYPIISILVWLLLQYSSSLPNMLLLTCTSMPLIILTSELAHRWIELPGIAVGKRIALSMQVMRLRSAANETVVPG